MDAKTFDAEIKAAEVSFVNQVEEAAASNPLYATDASRTAYTNLGFLEGTNYTEVMAKAKQKFIATQMKKAAMYLEPSQFPRDLVVLWNCSLLLQK